MPTTPPATSPRLQQEKCEPVDCRRPGVATNLGGRLRSPAWSGGPSPGPAPPMLEVEGAPMEAEDLRLDL